jgi:AraC-like DNA-binding protein
VARYSVAVLVDLDEFLVNAGRHGPGWAHDTGRAAEGVVRSTCGGRPSAAITSQPPDGWLVLLSGEDDAALAADAHALAMRLRDTVAEQTTTTASVAVSSVVEGGDSASRAVHEARATLHRKVLGGTRLVLPATGHRAFDPPDITRDLAALLRASATAEAVARVERWVRLILDHHVRPDLVFDVWLPGLVIELAAILDPCRGGDGSANWRRTLTHVPVADLAALGLVHEQSQLHRWLSRRFAALAAMAARPEPDALADRAERLLRRRFTDPQLTLGRAASALAVSPFHLAHVLRRDRDTTFRRYLTGLRVRTAIGLLGRGDLRVGEVARLCGFASVRQFRATIQRETGRTPTQLRLPGRRVEAGHEPADVAAQHQGRVGVAESGEDDPSQ